jgi:hypothetical protein
VEEIGAIDIYDANATIMNLVTFIFVVIYNRKTIICSLSINFINDKFSDVCAETTFHNDDSGSPGPGPMYRLNTPLIDPGKSLYIPTIL